MQSYEATGTLVQGWWERGILFILESNLAVPQQVKLRISPSHSALGNEEK